MRVLLLCECVTDACDCLPRFVENALKRDPRIAAFNAAQEADKMKRKNAKKDAIKAQQDAIEKQRLEEEARAAEEKKKQDAEKGA